MTTMTYQPELTLSADLLATIAEQGLDALPELAWVLVNEAMRSERQSYLSAAPYQRTAERRGRVFHRGRVVTGRNRVGSCAGSGRVCRPAP